MSKILKTLQQIRKDVEESNRPSAYGTRFVNDFCIVVKNLSEGAPWIKTDGNWAFQDCSFADKRMNIFVFRNKFLTRMTQFDKTVMAHVSRTVHDCVRAELLSPNNEQEEGLLIGTLTMCRVIEQLDVV